MEPQLANSIVTIAIGVIAVAVVLQTFSSIAAAIAAMKTKAAIDDVRAQIKPVAERAMEVLEQTRGTVTKVNEKLDPILAEAVSISAKARSIMERADEVVSRGQSQAEKLDEALTETVGRVRRQMNDVEETMGHVLEGVRSTSDHVHVGILTPIRKFNGIVNGLSAAVGFLLQGRTTVSRATQNDEMFI